MIPNSMIVMSDEKLCAHKNRVTQKSRRISACVYAVLIPIIFKCNLYRYASNYAVKLHFKPENISTYALLLGGTIWQYNGDTPDKLY